MSTIVSWNGGTYTVPDTGEENWGGATKVDGLLVSIANNSLQKSGGLFTLSADVNFGGSAGIVCGYIKSHSSNIATTGVLRFANNEGIYFRNGANSGNLGLLVNASDQLEFNGSVIGGTIPVNQGGTNITSYTTGDILYASGAAVLAKLGIGSSGQALRVSGGLPSWGTLGVAGGGTGLTSGTSGGILAFTAAGTLASSGALTVSQLVIGGGAGAAPTSLAAGSTGQALRIAGGIPAWGTLAEVGGGTNQTTYTLGDMLYASASNTLSKLAGNTAVSYRKSLGQTGAAGPVSAAPAWETPSRVNVVSKTTTYTATTDDEVINCSGSAFTVTLYAASGNAGRKLWIRKTDSTLANIITIDGNGSETINGALTTTLNTQYEVVCIECDGSNWFIVSRQYPKSLGSYTPTITGCGTVSNSTAFYFREGNCIRIQGSFTAGTVAASLASFSLPTSLAIDTALVTINNTTANPGPRVGGYTDNGATNSIGAIVLATSTSTSVAYFGLATALGTTALVPANGSATLVNSGVCSYEAIIPISGWKAD